MRVDRLFKVIQVSKNRAGEAAARLKDREALLFRSESSEYCYLIIAKILVIINKKEH